MGWWNLLCWCLGWRKPQVVQLTPAGNPLPKVIHKVLQTGDLGPGRLIIVGDVHGCYDVLLNLLEMVQYTPRVDNLILVGDLVDKGPKSREVVAAVRAWCEDSCCWVVCGNHDDAALAAGMYVQRGAAQNQLKAKFSWVGELLPDDVQFLTEMPFSLKVEGYNVVVVHAAMLPGVPLEAQDLGVLTKVRDLVQLPDGRWMGLEEGQEGSQAWAPCWQGPGHVFFGHDAKRNLQEAPHATGLDTGCVYGRQLTACVLPPLADLAVERDVVGSKERNGRKKEKAPKGKTQPSAASASGPQASQTAAGSGGLQSMQGSSSGLGGGAGAGLGVGVVPATPTLQQLRGELHSVNSGFILQKKPSNKAGKKKQKLRKIQ